MFGNERERLEMILQEVYDRVGVTTLSARNDNE